MKFSYKIQNKDGKIETGTMEAQDRFVLARQFRSSGATLISANEVKTGGIKMEISLFSSVSLREKILFTKNLSGMLKAGLSLARALEVLQKQTKNKYFKKVLGEIITDITNGGTLSDGMKKHSKVFSSLFVSMIRAGEESGGMVDALMQVGISTEKTYNLNKKIKGAMMYPGIIISAIIIIAILMFMFVVPTITKTFKDLNVALPFSTKIVIGISDALASHPILVFLGLIILVVSVLFLMKFPRVKGWIDFTVLRLPAVGNLVRETNSARVARTLSSLLSAGVDVVRALTITKDVVNNKYYKNSLDQAIEVVQKGGTLSSVFKEFPILYPVMVGEMVEVGEETGKFSAMLSDVAIFYESEVEEKTKNLSTIIEPVLMVFIGAGVGFFAISMLSPMYSLVDSIK